jgi:hypothetical protein
MLDFSLEMSAPCDGRPRYAVPADSTGTCFRYRVIEILVRVCTLRSTTLPEKADRFTAVNFQGSLYMLGGFLIFCGDALSYFAY